MPTWGAILQEINVVGQQLAQIGAPISPFDIVRRKYLQQLSAKTGRPTILYAAAWTTRLVADVSPELIQITNEDTHALMETVHGLPGSSLDLIIHSPGGSPAAAEAIVTYLRTRYRDVRVIVPHMAMSAATMLACSANRIVMGKHSFLGPIDPQMIMQTATGIRAVPAQAIIAQFEKAREECNDPAKLRAWLPMLNQYGPDLLVTCKNVSELSQALVRTWLKEYMFDGHADGEAKATEIASWLAGHDNHLSHGRPLARDVLKAHGLIIDDLEADQEEQDLVLSVFHAVSHCFSATPVVKITENNIGKAFVKFAQPGVQLQPVPRPQDPPPPTPGPIGPGPA